jgi:hypothetical protein
MLRRSIRSFVHRARSVPARLRSANRAGASDRLRAIQGPGPYVPVEVRCSCLLGRDRSAIKRPGGKIWVPPCGYAVNFPGRARAGPGAFQDAGSMARHVRPWDSGCRP